MKISKIIGITLLVIGVVSFTSCTKEFEDKLAEHETTAPHSAVKSMNITVFGGDWNFVNSYMESTKSASIITTEIVNTGAVLCYYKYEDTYVQMPITETVLAGTYLEHIQSTLFYYQTGSITFRLENSELLNPTITFKVVTIESSKLKNSTNVDFKNYAEVKKAFNLAD